MPPNATLLLSCVFVNAFGAANTNVACMCMAQFELVASAIAQSVYLIFKLSTQIKRHTHSAKAREREDEKIAEQQILTRKKEMYARHRATNKH